MYAQATAEQHEESSQKIVSTEELKGGKIYAVSTDDREAIAELEEKGFTRTHETEDVVMLRAPGGIVGGYSTTRQSMTVNQLTPPNHVYPVCSVGESRDLPPVSAFCVL